MRSLLPTASLRRSFHPSSRWCASVSRMSQALRTTSAPRLTSSSDRWHALTPSWRRSLSSKPWRPIVAQPPPDERAVLARFSGFGDSSFEPAFRLSAHRPEDNPWVERGHRLRSLVDDGEWQSLERSRLNAFFTSPDPIGAIWDGLLALRLGDISAP